VRVHCGADDATPRLYPQEPTNVSKPVLRVALIATALALAVAAFAGGCAKRHRIEIQSDTCWTSTVDNFGSATTNDCGNARFRVAGDIHCVAPLGSAEACR